MTKIFLCRLALTKVQQVLKYFEVSLQILRKDGKLIFRQKKCRNTMSDVFFSKLTFFCRG